MKKHENKLNETKNKTKQNSERVISVGTKTKHLCVGYDIP